MDQWIEQPDIRSIHEAERDVMAAWGGSCVLQQNNLSQQCAYIHVAWQYAAANDLSDPLQFPSKWSCHLSNSSISPPALMTLLDAVSDGLICVYLWKMKPWSATLSKLLPLEDRKLVIRMQCCTLTSAQQPEERGVGALCTCVCVCVCCHRLANKACLDIQAARIARVPLQNSNSAVLIHACPAAYLL